MTRKNDPHIASQHRKHAQAQQRVARTYPRPRRHAPVSCLQTLFVILLSVAGIAFLAVKGSNDDYEKAAARDRAEARRKIDPLWKGYKQTLQKPAQASKGGCLPIILFLTWLLLA